jgi:hypothetical protein
MGQRSSTFAISSHYYFFSAVERARLQHFMFNIHIYIYVGRAEPRPSEGDCIVGVDDQVRVLLTQV